MDPALTSQQVTAVIAENLLEPWLNECLMLYACMRQQASPQGSQIRHQFHKVADPSTSAAGLKVSMKKYMETHFWKCGLIHTRGFGIRSQQEKVYCDSLLEGG